MTTTVTLYRVSWPTTWDPGQQQTLIRDFDTKWDAADFAERQRRRYPHHAEWYPIDVHPNPQDATP